jgi:hypothetical protein
MGPEGCGGVCSLTPRLYTRPTFTYRILANTTVLTGNIFAALIPITEFPP